jgi:hypothetical protein
VAAKYGGRSSISKDDVPRYGGRTSSSKDDLVPRYSGRSSLTKDDLSKYRPTSRTTSREDLSLSSGSQKYINSRFLPKNSVEKSYTAYSRPSSIRSHEALRKNRELLNALHVQQEQERASRPTSRCSSVAPDDHGGKTPLPTQKESAMEMETVNTVTRSTSPGATASNIARARRSEIAKIVEKKITRPKNRIGVEKEVQSDRVDDAKNSRVSGASRTSATPWSSFLDMKFSSPNDKQKKKGDSSPKSISRNSSNKSLSQEKKSPPKTKISPPKQNLPPQIPKSDSSKSTSLHSINATNKDFRKSVLNMSTEGGGKKKVGRRSNSASSAESETEVQASEATDVSENLASCPSYHKSHSSGSKLPQLQKVSSKASLQRSRRSPSSDASTSSSSTSEEEKKSDVKVTSSRTSIAVSSADELSTDKSPKPPPSPRLKSEAEAKSFLMRALAPVTNFFKTAKYQGLYLYFIVSNGFANNVFLTDSNEKVSWMEDTISESAPSEKPKSDQRPGKLFKKVESGERAWWLDDTTASSSLPRDSEKTGIARPKTLLRHVESGELAWWLDKNAEIPEGVQVYPDESKMKIFRLDSSESSDPSKNIMDPEYQERHKIRHIDSGERSWWLNSAENIPEMVQARESKTEQPKFAIRHQESGEKAWWLKSNSHSEEFDATQALWVTGLVPKGWKCPKRDKKGD